MTSPITCPLCGGTEFKADKSRQWLENGPDFVYCAKCLSSYNAGLLNARRQTPPPLNELDAELIRIQDNYAAEIEAFGFTVVPYDPHDPGWNP